MGVVEKWKAKIPRIEVVEKKPKKRKEGTTLGKMAGGNVKCVDCGLWMDVVALPGHQRRRHSLDVEKSKTPTKAPLEGGRARPADDKKKTNPPPRPTPKPTPKPAAKPTPSGGTNMGANTRPIENGNPNPAAGTGDNVVQAFNTWAEMMPANFKAARREAETMGETFRGIADAFRRRAANMVEQLSVDPSCVEPYEEAANKASVAADDFMEVATRIEQKYSKHIEVVNDPSTPNLNFLDEEGDR